MFHYYLHLREKNGAVIVLLKKKKLPTGPKAESKVVILWIGRRERGAAGDDCRGRSVQVDFTGKGDVK